MTHNTRMIADSEPTATALFFVETRNRAEVEEVEGLAVDLAQHGEIRRICHGVITAYAVRLPASGAPLLAGLETTLKRDFLFGHVEMPFQETICRVVEDLAIDTHSDITPLDSCEICHQPTPFPADVRVMGEDGRMRQSRSVYCIACAANMAAGKPAEAAPAEAPTPVAASA